eukprot:TRINITY_DN7025_c1_g1_i4.p1 TRINITY_DN7025_c1_g1~~TRINITY_DN7025_c1_g1_i4.p1  ORF type:complete len:362 (-),score=38.63 TRINITY_DN7025_c1_g1_i4:345-1403(-)
MSWLEEILYVEATPVGVIGAIIIHASLWYVMTDWNWGFVGCLSRTVKKLFPDFYKNTVCENYKGDALVEMYRMHDDPGAMLFWLGATVVHHAWGGALMYMGYTTNRPWLWRHGMLTEVGGLDLLDFAKIAYAKLFPPGSFPMSVALESPLYLPFTASHHTVGIIVGLPVCIYFSDLPEFQWFGVMILGAPFFVAGPDVVGRCIAPERRTGHLLIELWMVISFGYQRVLYYYPATWSLLKHVHAANIPTFVTCGFFLGAFLLSVFNLMGIGIMGHGWVKKWILGDEHSRVPSSTNISEMMTAVTRRNVVKLYGASRMIGKLHQARNKIHEQDGSPADDSDQGIKNRSRGSKRN